MKVCIHYYICWQYCELDIGWLQTYASRTFSNSSRIRVLTEHTRISGQILYVLHHGVLLYLFIYFCLYGTLIIFFQSNGWRCLPVLNGVVLMFSGYSVCQLSLTQSSRTLYFLILLMYWCYCCYLKFSKTELSSFITISC